MLKKLSEHNKKNTPSSVNKVTKNGIACPECGNELTDTSPSKTVFIHVTPEKGVSCSCGWKGFRAAIVTMVVDPIDNVEKVVYK